MGEEGCTLVRADNRGWCEARLPLPTTYYFCYSLPGKGSRCEEDTNAFWSAAAALLPQDLIEKRQARAAGRILGLNYQQVALCTASLVQCACCLRALAVSKLLLSKSAC